MTWLVKSDARSHQKDSKSLAEADDGPMLLSRAAYISADAEAEPL
jgi:hypothetical protein